MDCTTLEPVDIVRGRRRLFTGERRAFPRLKVELFGVCSIGGNADVTCLARDMSVSGMALLCDAPAALDAEVTVSLPQVGLLRGRLARTFPHGFAIVFAEGRLQRERVSNFLTWLVERDTDADLEDRVHARIVPLRRLVTLQAAGEASMARIVDVSRSGVALTSTSTVQIDDEVVVGSRRAVVVRMLEGGFAARFVEPLGSELDVSIIL